MGQRGRENWEDRGQEGGRIDSFFIVIFAWLQLGCQFCASLHLIGN